ncbi:MAG TPA: hypothetical protein VNZ44_06365, partial [Pyrinomonadaceae bacterium]|nr:hypothetical protein [Pyrinomonadaceae bacterium]
MPITPTYPGVYIEELPSGVRTITGVATSITAFIGRALRGPVNESVSINSFADFDRIFGGLWVESSLGYAVRDFYLNGGSQAIIVRLFHPFYATEDERADALDAAQDASAAAQAVGGGAPAADVAAAARGVANNPANANEPRKSASDAVADAAEAAATGGASNADTKAAAASAAAGFSTRSTLDANGLGLAAAYEGAWANKLRARIDHDVNPTAPDKADLFNLPGRPVPDREVEEVRDGTTGQIEIFRNLSFRAGHPREVGRVLANESSLVRMTGTLGSRPAKHDDPDPTATPPVELWKDNNTNDKVTGEAVDGGSLAVADFIGAGLDGKKLGLYALKKADLF